MNPWDVLARLVPLLLDAAAVLVYPQAHGAMAQRVREKSGWNGALLVGLYALFALACYALRKLGTLKAADGAARRGAPLVERVAHSPAIGLFFVAFGMTTMIFAAELSGGMTSALSYIERQDPAHPNAAAELTATGYLVLVGGLALLFAPLAINVVDVRPTIERGTPRFLAVEAAALVVVNLMIVATEACIEVTFTPAAPPKEPTMSMGAGMLLFVPLLLLCYAGPRVVLFRAAPHWESLASFLVAIGWFARRLTLAGAG